METFTYKDRTIAFCITRRVSRWEWWFQIDNGIPRQGIKRSTAELALRHEVIDWAMREVDIRALADAALVPYR